MFIMYVILFAAATHNTVRYIWGGIALYKNFHLTYFYCMVYIVILLRIAWYILILVAIRDWDGSWVSQWGVDSGISRIDFIATYAELLIGIQ